MSEKTEKRRPYDRREGRRIRSLGAFNSFIPFIMPTRQGANNLFGDSIEVTEIDHWLRQKRLEGYKGLGMLHLLIAAYIRTVSQLPGLNRFVSGQRIYARDTIDVVLTVKRALTMDASETTVKVSFTPRDTIYDVYEKFNAVIAPIKADTGDNGTEAAARMLSHLPRFLLRLCLWILRTLDYYDLMPGKLLEVSPFHGSLFVTDLGSLGIPPVYHHLYNFGNLPIFMSFGAKRRVMELDAQGNPVERKYIDYTVDTDERIADGFYFATAFKRMKHYLRHPEQLETPPETVKQDID